MTRYDDFIEVSLPLYGDGDGHAGWSAGTRARLALYRDGILIAESS